MWIINGTVFLNGKFEKKDIRVADGKIAEITEPGGGYPEESLDAADKYIIPGLVDIHTHGRDGEDFSHLTEEGLQKLLNSYAEAGVTSVLGTTMTNEPSSVERSLQIMARHRSSSDGARLLGIHMEGPFLGKEKKGAHDETYLRNPDWEWFIKMQEASGGLVRLVTIDPTLPGTEEFIKKCSENGIRVSLGHTVCDYETAGKAQRAGADHVTHLFNAMNSLHHREPGLIGTAMDTGMYMELICDGIHVHPALIRLLFAAHPDNMILISDSIPAAGMPEGEYQSGGLQVKVKNGKAVLADGTIAGSTISLFDAMVNAIKFGVPAEQAVNSATFIPAKSLGMENEVGSIVVGRRADILIANKEWTVEKWCEGGKGR